MKKVMWDSVEERKGNIFQDIVNKIHVGFEEMIDMNVKALIGKIVHDILPRMAKDYLYLLSGGTTLATSISRQRSTDEILKILHESKQVFKKILDDEKDLHPGDDGPDIVPGAYSEEKIEPDETIAVPAIEEPERSGHVSNDTSSTLSSALSSQSSNGSDTNIGARAD